MIDPDAPTLAQVRRLVRSLRKEIYAHAETHQYYAPYHVDVFMLPTLRDHMAACRVVNKLVPDRGAIGKGTVFTSNPCYTWAPPLQPLAGFVSFRDKALTEQFRAAMKEQEGVATYLCTATPRATESVLVTTAQGQKKTHAIYYKFC